MAPFAILPDVKGLLLAVLSAAVLTAADAPDRATIQGAVSVQDDQTLVLTTAAGVAHELIVEEPDPFHTLQDPALAGRTWELEGFHREGDRFEVRALSTIKDGKRYQVSYYCEICHITSYRPGRCMCCQKMVELRETPVEE